MTDASLQAPPPAAGIGAELVSVIVPCYNAEAFLRSTLDSVLRQSHAALELLVVDDRSTDGSPGIVREFAARDARVRLLEMPRNAGGPAAPRNLGVAAAQGRWIALLDADDIWHPHKLEMQLRALAETGAVMCSTQMADFRDEREIVVRAVPEPLPLQRVTLRQQLVKYRTPTSSIVASRELMRAHPFNEDPSYKAREDTDVFIRVHESMHSSVKIAHPMVYYRQQATQISGNKLKMVSRHFHMLRRYRLRSGRGLGPMVYVYTATHFLASLWIRWIRKAL
jgi:teichuronic acid biosynthesis glycosyltransferase TuaG